MINRPPRRIRRIALAGASVMAFGAATVLTVNFASATSADNAENSLAAPPDCQLHELPYPDEYGMSFALSMDPTGTYLAGRGYPEDPASGYERYLMIWEEGEPTEIEVDGGDQNISGINSNGEASIYTYLDDLVPTPMAYIDGEVVELAHDVPAQANGINEDGVIVGTLQISGVAESQPVYWETADSEPVELELPDGVESGTVNAIDGDTVIGSIQDPELDEPVPARWNLDGTVEKLAIPDDSEQYRGFAQGVRDGWISGTVWLEGSSDSVAVLWSEDGDVEVLGPGSGYGVNSEGWVVGTSDGLDYALLWADGEVTELPGLVDGEYTSDQANAISDDGSTIFGSVDTDVDEAHSLAAAEWTCE